MRTVFLKMPDSFQWKIYHIIEKGARLKHIVIFAGMGGMLISLLELVCTGQIYLPTIMYIMSGRVSSFQYKAEALFYLFLYCLMFIIPLLMVFLLVYLGMATEKIEMFGQKHFALVKLLNSIVFLFFSGYLLYFALRLF